MLYVFFAVRLIYQVTPRMNACPGGSAQRSTMALEAVRSNSRFSDNLCMFLIMNAIYLQS
jgi:hypothetical protein